MASSSSTSIRKYTFEVFLSFRGEDTRYTFTDRLFETLDRMGINTFRDDQLERGEEIKSELLKTIEESRISIVVFSKTYAHSKWCLDELAKIMECREEMDQIVLPVFYHVDPSDVRKQTGSFSDAFSIHEGNVDEKKMRRWRDSLTEASNLCGFHVNDGLRRYESEHINEILNEISKRLNPKQLYIQDEPIGIDSHLNELKSLLSTHLNDIRAVGIYGIGGIGKTTIAKIVYNEIQCQFTGASFLQDVREKSTKGCQLQLQQQILHDIVGKDVEFSNVNEGINRIQGRLRSKKILIVIDDVDDLEQLHPLVGNLTWFGPGSRIIITTRNQHLLHEYGVSALHEVTKLPDEEALQLFNRHAFKQGVPQEDYIHLSKDMVEYAKGLPLALKVLGSYLLGMTIDEWKNTLDKLKKHLMQKINDVLRISFDGLELHVKEVFLDIACFFKRGCKDSVLRILDACNLYATCGIKVLQDRCLVTIVNNVIQMHDLIQQMGWTIVREEYPREPSKWSRLWDVDDICDAFSREEGMENIQTISLHLSELKEIRFTTNVFVKMKKLRLLKIYDNDHEDLMRKKYKVLLLKNFEFPHNLRYLHWDQCTLKSFPSKFYGENLIEIDLKSSNLKQLWKGNQCLGNLKAIDLSNSKQLVKIPKFSSMPNLERLNLEGCKNLCALDSSIGDLKRLVYLNLRGCEQIQSFPSGKRFESLEVLYLNGCPNLKKFPEIHKNMEHLTKLYLSGSGIRELPSSIVYLASLEVLDLSYCSNFEKFPEIKGNMNFLRELDLRGCSNFEKFPDIFMYLGHLRGVHLVETGIKELPDSIGYLECLVNLFLDGTAIKELPNSIGTLTSLERLSLRRSGVKELPSGIGLLESLEILDISCCSNFQKFPEIQAGNMKCLKKIQLDGTAIKELPSGIELLESLEILDLSHCSNFQKFPEIKAGNMKCLKNIQLDGTAIKELPSGIGLLESLEILDISRCSNFQKFPEIQAGNMKCLKKIQLDGTAIKELPSGIGGLRALETLSLNGCSNLETFPEIEKDMGNLSTLFLGGTAIKGLPYSIGHLTRLEYLNLDDCRNLRSLPNSIFGLKSMKSLFLIGCSNLEAFSEIKEDMEQLNHLSLHETGIIELPSPIEYLRCLESLELFSCENLVALPDSIGNLTCLTALRVRHCSKLQYLPDNLRSLQCCLKELNLGGCINLKEGQIPSDFWCLSLLETLEISENHMCCIPSGIIQLCKLQTLLMNHCPMLKEIGELPSSLTDISAHGCPFLEIEASSSLLWSSLLKIFKSPIQGRVYTLVPGSSTGIPEWVSHQRMGSEIRIELPMNWYEDDNFLGFALFFYHVPVDDDECSTTAAGIKWELISQDIQSKQLDSVLCLHSCWFKTYRICTKDPGILVMYLPWIDIPSEYRCRRWNNFKAHFYTLIGDGSFWCGDDICFRVESCGIHLIYTQDQNN